MPIPLVLIHGYSADGHAFDALRDALTAPRPGVPPRSVADIDIANYVSLNNEITIVDIAEGLDRAFRNHPVLKDDRQPFDAVVHSTGMLVLRSWLVAHGGPVESNPRLQRLKHLIGLAPATWGSPQASKGRTWLGALIKGNREPGPDFMNAGDRILEGLELGSDFTWKLAHKDLLGPEPFYTSDPGTPYVAVFIGNRGYTGVASLANSPGSDGTVRWSGCSLNTRKLTLDLTRIPVGPGELATRRFAMSPWADTRLDVPMIAVDGKNHGTLIAEPDPEMVARIAAFLQVADAPGYAAWLDEAKKFGEKAKQAMLVDPVKATGLAGEAEQLVEHLVGAAPELDGWQQFVVRCVDSHGDPVDDYFMDLIRIEGDKEITCQTLFEDVHAYGLDSSYRCFHVKLPRGAAQGTANMKVRLHASTGTELMCYQGYGNSTQQLSAGSEPVELDISDLARQANTLFVPFTTVLIEIQVNREPLPLSAISRVLNWEPNPAAAPPKTSP